MKKYNILFWLIPFLFLTIFLIANFNMVGFFALLALIVLTFLFVGILHNPFLGLTMMIFTLPLERIPTLDIGLFTLKIDQLFAGMTLVVLLLQLVLNRRKFLPFPIGWPIIFFLFISFLSLFFAEDFSRAISVFIFILFMILVSWSTVNLIDSKEKLIKIIKTFFLAALIVCFFALYQFIGDIAGLPITLTGLKDIYTKAVLGFPRVQAFSMEPLYLANYLFIPLSMSAALFFFKQTNLISRNKLFILMSLILLIIILGISRGAYIALGVMIIFFLLFLARNILTVRNIITTIIITAFVLGSVYFFLNQAKPEALDNFISHAKIEDYSKSESVQKRLLDYQKAWEFWQESPWIGIGLGNYGPRYKNYPPHDQVTDWEIVNNQYIETLTETGILGLVFLSLVILLLFWRSLVAYRNTKDMFLKAILFGLLAAFIAILVQYNFFSTLYIMHIWVLIGLIIVVQNLIFNSKLKTHNEKPQLKS